MNTLRRLLLLCAAAAGFFGIYWAYENHVKPQEKVWNEASTRRPTKPIIVVYDQDFEKVIPDALQIWNKIVPGLFATDGFGNIVRILSATGEPCGQQTSHETAGHAATSYECPDGSWEIHVSKPGDIHTQLYIVAHELGHVLGLADDQRGSRIMRNNFEEVPTLLLVSDKDAEAIKERYQ